MKIELNVSQFRDLFTHSSNYNGKYSYEALEIIFDWYEENEPDYDFDMGEVVSSWSDFSDFDELFNDYKYLVAGDEYFDELDEDERIDYLINEIEQSTSAVYKYTHNSSFLILA